MGDVLKCPKCGGSEVADLAQRAGQQLHQCGKCLHEFGTVIVSVLPSTNPGKFDIHELAPRRRERRNTTEKKPKEEVMANCWCGRSEGHSGKHRGKGAAVKAAKRTPAKAASSRPQVTGGVLDLAIAQLRTKRDEILAGIPELREVDAAIKALEALGETRPTPEK